ncbi:hypothetical protein [uncultured Anoxybacillus sp.]|uniref:hypothetical protein n=1 Tax=uncultured Anoxybacillus sp. TaxID=263860 RepID=UPI00260CCBD8|nr:hypothetical protein [uncultured Anoxybacillus sp.]
MNEIGGVKNALTHIWEGSRNVVKATSDYIKDNKWEIAASVAVGVATGGAGFVVSAGRIVVSTAVKSVAKEAAKQVAKELGTTVTRATVQQASKQAMYSVYKESVKTAAKDAAKNGAYAGVGTYASFQISKYYPKR